LILKNLVEKFKVIMKIRKSCLKIETECDPAPKDLIGERIVAFHGIEFLEFSTILGDNPSCR
jgi:hypothetical protein